MSELGPSAERRALESLIGHLDSDLILGLEELARSRTIAPPGADVAASPTERPARPTASPPARAARPPVPRDVSTRVPALKERLGPADKRARLEALDAEVRACQNCPLSATRTHGVPGEGNVDADLMFIGEGPGADEDRSGRPFVGAAGELLTRIIDAMGFSRETVFIANIVKCRPPGNRDPLPPETDACFPYLERQIEIIEPKVICTLGSPATKTLLKIDTGITRARGKKYAFRDTPVIPTYHPAYLLRNAAGKPQVWQDVQLIGRLIQERGGTIPHPDALERSRKKQ